MNTKPLIKGEYIGIKLEPEIKARLLEKATKDGMTLSDCVRLAIVRHVRPAKVKS